MRLRRVFVKLFCIPFTCALFFMAVASSATFASTTQHTAPAPCSVVLKRGATDANSQGKVTILQQKLKADGEDLGSKGIDGIFGGMTEAAVKAYQGKSDHKDENGHPLLVDGIVGAHTWHALGECDAPAQSSQPSSNPAVQPVLCSADNLDNNKVVTINSGTTTSTGTQFTVATQNAGAKGCATFTFSKQDPNTLTNITLAVKDINGDSHQVYIQLGIDDTRQGSDNSHQLRHNNGGGAGSKAQDWPNLSYTNKFTGRGSPTYRITGVLVMVCVDVQFGGDSCANYYISSPYK